MKNKYKIEANIVIEFEACIDDNYDKSDEDYFNFLGKYLYEYLKDKNINCKEWYIENAWVIGSPETRDVNDNCEYCKTKKSKCDHKSIALDDETYPADYKCVKCGEVYNDNK